MPVHTERVLAMRCPECGRLGYHSLSRFAISPGEDFTGKCSCGELIFTISTSNRTAYRIRVNCIFCEGYHTYSYTARQIWGLGGMQNLLCLDTGLELGHIGMEEEVRTVVAGQEAELEALVSEFTRDNFFNNNKVMFEALRRLHQVASRGAITCQCGNHQIEVELFPDRLELHCRRCASINIIYAETDDDLRLIRETEEIELTRNGFEYLDSLLANGKNKKKTKAGRNHKS